MSEPATLRSFQRTRSLAAVLLLGAGTTSCYDNLLVPENNRTPTAVAGVVDREGSSVAIDFSGQPVTLRLDASKSSDPDHDALEYRWLSGTLAKPPAAGSGGSGADEDAGQGNAEGELVSHARWVPPGAAPNWPDDVERPEVELRDGTFAFTLWVVDSKGAISDPSTVEIAIAPPIDPALQDCVDSVLPTVPKSCSACVCGVSETCQAAANMSVCGADCWGLINCIGSKCPNYANGDTACVSAMCSAFLGGASGAMMLGSCVAMCASQCRSG